MSKRPKLTPWIDGKITPKRVGVYERNYNIFDTGRLYCYWNGLFWGLNSDSKSGASVWASIPSDYEDLPWRGLASNPKVKK